MKKFALSLCAALSIALAGPASSTQLELLKKHMNLVVPLGEGPFPVILLIPGCNGFHAGYQRAQERWAQEGFMSARVDSSSARGLSCHTMHAHEAIGDVALLARYVRSLAKAKPGALNAMGFSWGGAIALAAAAEEEIFDKAIVWYPACDFVLGVLVTPVKVKTLALHGDADGVAPIRNCDAIYEGSNVQLKVYPGAIHGFNTPANFHEEAMEDARRRYREFLAK